MTTSTHLKNITEVPASLLMNITDVSAALSVGRSTIYALINGGRLKVVKLGRATRITTESVRTLVVSDGALTFERCAG